MGVDKTKYTSQYIDNISFNDSLQIKETLNYEFDGNGITAKPSSLVAKKITVSGSDTYVACAPVGTAQATAGWQVKKINVTGGDTVITWADGNTNFDNSAVDLTALDYS